MNIDTAKRIAQRLECQLWYDQQTHLWDLISLEAQERALGIEASGGCFMSPGELRELTPLQFHDRCVSALQNLDGKTDQMKRKARLSIGQVRNSDAFQFTTLDMVTVHYFASWADPYLFAHNGVRIDEERMRELVG